MKPLLYLAVLLLLLLTGCGSSNEGKLKLFSESCKVPLSGSMTFGEWGTSLTVACAEFKSDSKVTK